MNKGLIRGVTVNCRRLQFDQRGFTLIEMLVVVVLIGIIAAGIAMTISQVMAVNSRTSSHMVALRQVQQAGDRVSKDVLQADDVTFVSNSTTLTLTLTIPYYYDHEGTPTRGERTVEYWLDDDKLMRTYDDGVSPVTTTVARYILLVDPDDAGKIMTSLGDAEEPGAYVFKVSAKVGMRIETREYEVKPRPGS